MVNRWSQGAPYGTTAIPYIGENGNWWVNQEDTGVKAQGPQGQQGQRGEAGIGVPGPALMYEDMTEEQKLELASHYTDDMQAIKDSCIADTNALIATAKTEMDATKAAALEEAATTAEEKTAGIVNKAVENAQAEIDASVATATTNINAAAANAENSKVAAQEAANSATATLESMQNIKQETITAAQNTAAETATSTVNTLVEQAQADINANITEAKNVATAAATNADASKVEANASANSAASSATAAANSATEANAAKVAAEAAANSVTLDADAMNAAVQASKSYAVGGTGTREGEDADNSKYYYGLCKTLAESNSSSYMGECAYADLPADAPVGAVYKITDNVNLMTEEDYPELRRLTCLGKQYEVEMLIFSKAIFKGDLLICTAAGVWELFARDLGAVVDLSLEFQDLSTKCDAYKRLDPSSYVDPADVLLGSYITEPVSLGTCTVTWDDYSSAPCSGVFKVFKDSITEGEASESGYYEFTVATCNLEEYSHYSLFFNNDNYSANTSISIINRDSGVALLENIGNTALSNVDDTLPNFYVSTACTVDVVLKVPKIASFRNALHTIRLYIGPVTLDRFETINDMTVSAWKATKTALTTLEEVDAVTESGKLVDAMAVKELNRNLGDFSGFTNDDYPSIGAFIQYCVDNGFLPDINSIPLIPIMTSDTTPSGVASASSVWNSSYHAYYAFDNNDTTLWVANTYTNSWVGYEFTEAKIANRAKIIVPSHKCKNFKIQASNDGSNWVDLYTGVNSDNSGSTKTIDVRFNNNTAYKKYRLFVIDTYGSNENYVISCQSLQLYERV